MHIVSDDRTTRRASNQYAVSQFTRIAKALTAAAIGYRFLSKLAVRIGHAIRPISTARASRACIIGTWTSSDSEFQGDRPGEAEVKYDQGAQECRIWLSGRWIARVSGQRSKVVPRRDFPHRSRPTSKNWLMLKIAPGGGTG